MRLRQDRMVYYQFERKYNGQQNLFNLTTEHLRSGLSISQADCERVAT